MSRKHLQDKHKCVRCGIVKLRADMCLSSSGRVQSVCLACDVPPPGMKWCTAHKVYEPVENFGLNKARRDGLAAVCLQGKGYYDKRRRAESLAARGDAVQDDVMAMECKYCPFEKGCVEENSRAYLHQGPVDDLPCMPTSSRYPEYAKYVRAKRAAVRKGHRRVETINFVMTVGD